MTDELISAYSALDEAIGERSRLGRVVAELEGALEAGRGDLSGLRLQMDERARAAVEETEALREELTVVKAVRARLGEDIAALKEEAKAAEARRECLEREVARAMASAEAGRADLELERERLGAEERTTDELRAERERLTAELEGARAATAELQAAACASAARLEALTKEHAGLAAAAEAMEERLAAAEARATALEREREGLLALSEEAVAAAGRAEAAGAGADAALRALAEWSAGLAPAVQSAQDQVLSREREYVCWMTPCSGLMRKAWRGQALSAHYDLARSHGCATYRQPNVL